MGSPKRRDTTETGVLCRGVRFTVTTAATLLLRCACFAVLAQTDPVPPGDAQSSPAACASNNGVFSCRCEAPVPAPPLAAEEGTATLSEDSPNMDLTCVGSDNSGTPDTMSQGYVCPGSANVDACLTTPASSNSESRVGKENTPVKLNTLLAQGAGEVQWKQESAGNQNQQKYSLNVPKDSFPLLDKEFFVGCKDAKAVVCKVSVALTARKSTTLGQVVTCAYGSKSNEKRQSVTLTPSNNKLTIICGDGGKMVPDEYLTMFCAYGQDLAGCASQPFTGLLPEFDQSWWGTKASQATLTIPAESFPVDEQRFALGCQYNLPGDLPSKGREAESRPPPSETSVCSVDVIITKTPTTTTTPATTSASRSVFAARDGGSAVVALVVFYALQAVPSLG